MAGFHNWTGDELIDTQVPQFLNEDNTATQEKLDTKFNKSLDIAKASDLNNFKDEGFYCCNTNSRAETILNCPTNYAFGLMVWGKGTIVYQEVREYNRSSKNQERNNCWRRSYYFDTGVQDTWSSWQQVAYTATTLAGYGITDGMSKKDTNSVSVTDIMQRDVNTSYLRLMGGNAVVNGAALQLCGGAYTADIADAGEFSLKATDSTHSAVLLGRPSGLLKWNNKNIVRSVNNIAADSNGNVDIAISGVTVDAELSSTSTNPVQNKVIYNALEDKMNTADVLSGFALLGGATNIRWREGTQFVGSINAANYSGTARAATHDGAGNIIVDTYAKKTDISGMVKSVNGTAPDESGNVTITATGGVSTSSANTWTAVQEFYNTKTFRTCHTGYYVENTSDTPVTDTMWYTTNGDFTLNLSNLAMLLGTYESIVFSAYFTADADHVLTISGAGTMTYIGSASDIAISGSGTLLTVWMIKNPNGVVSIVQAHKLGSGT